MTLRVPILAALAIGGITALGCSSVDTKTSPAALKCQVGLTVGQPTIVSSGGAGSVTIAAQPECTWTAASEASWITGVTPTSGQGNGEVRFQVTANPGTASREGNLIVNDIRAHVTQSGNPCVIVLSATSQQIPASGASGSVNVTAPTGCTWSASSNAPWLVVTSGANGSGDGSVGFTVSANAGSARGGTIAIGGQSFDVAQLEVGVVPCSYVLQPAAASIGPGAGTTPVSVQAVAGCGWSATSNASWLTFAGGTTGTGNGSVTLSATANSGNSRTGTATIAGQTFTVAQAGSCAVAINLSAQTVAAAGGSATPVNVTAAGGCGWTGATTAPWITITAGASGSGNGTVSFNVAANSGPTRTGTVTIGGQLHTVTQTSGCAVSINPAAQTVAAGTGNGTPITVTAATGCSWASATADSWITITAGATGIGNGTVNFSVGANSGPARSGTIIVGSQVHTVTQNSGCTFSINPTSLSVNKNATTNRQVTVTTTSTCPWTATSNASWLTITSGASGTGNGTVRFDIAMNNTGNDRLGTITIAGITFTVDQSK